MSSTKKQIRFYGFSFKPAYAKIFIPVVVMAVFLSAYLLSLKFGIWGQARREATLILSFENGGKGRMFQGEVVEGMTVLSALIASAEAGQIKLQYAFDSGNKVVINTLNGYLKDSKTKISFYLNNNRIDTGDIHKVPINGGDSIEARLE